MGNRRLLFLLAALGVNYLLFQSILVPYAMVEKVNIPIIEEHEGMHTFVECKRMLFIFQVQDEECIIHFF
jgi:hypothetical protein